MHFRHYSERITNTDLAVHMIAAVGIAVVDHIMLLDGFKSGPGSYHADAYIIEGGGMAATALCAASKLGSSATLFTRIGDDLNGDFILEGLHRFGVNTDGVLRIPGRRSTVSIVMVDRAGGEKQFYSERVKGVFEDERAMDETLLHGAEVLLVDGYWLEAARRAAAYARERSIPVVADFKRAYEDIESLFPFLDYCILPDFFARELTGESEPETILRALREIQAGTPVVTEGGRGGYWLCDGRIRRFPVFHIECVDSTGAGDAFHGAFCHFLSRNVPLERALELSSAVGALNCRAHGGRTALPGNDELESFLMNHGVDHTIPR